MWGLALKKSIFVFLATIHFLMLVLLLNTVLPSISLIPDVWTNRILNSLDFMFYKSAPIVFLSLLLIFCLNLIVFVVGYNLCRRHRVGGTLVYIFSLIIDLVLIITALMFSFFGILFSIEIALPFKILLAIAYLPFFGVLLFFTVEKLIDTSFFFNDVLKERKEYGKLRYSVKRKGKLTYVTIDNSKSNVTHLLSAAPTLLIEQALCEIGEARSISRFFKNALANFFLEIFTHITAWHRTRVFFFKTLAGAKVGKDCRIGQWTRFDPIFPDLIDLEEDCGVGIGCTFLTHSYIGAGQMTFYFGPVKICRHARIGAHSVILPGVTIGEGAIVGAGSVVNKDVPPHTLAAGAPAKIRKRKSEMT